MYSSLTSGSQKSEIKVEPALGRGLRCLSPLPAAPRAPGTPRLAAASLFPTVHLSLPVPHATPMCTFLGVCDNRIPFPGHRVCSNFSGLSLKMTTNWVASNQSDLLSHARQVSTGQQPEITVSTGWVSSRHSEGDPVPGLPPAYTGYALLGVLWR